MKKSSYILLLLLECHQSKSKLLVTLQDFELIYAALNLQALED